MANGARMDGIEADLFFTFFGLDAIRKDRYEKIKVATVGNPGLHMPTLLGALPGFSALATKMMQRQMEKIDIPPIREFIELVHDSGVHLYACKASVDMFALTMEDFVPQVEDIISVGEFYEKAAGGQIIFTSGGDMAAGTHFSADEARRVGAEIGIDWDSAPFDLEQFRKG